MSRRRLAHDAAPPPLWPDDVTYLVRPRLEKTFPAALVPLLLAPPQASSQPAPRFAPQATPHPAGLVGIKRVDDPGHPAHGQRCLVARRAIRPGELVIPYLGEIHTTFTPAAEDPAGTGTDTIIPPQGPSHEDSDYDLSLLRLSASDPRNPFAGYHVSVGVDAAAMGNAARFVNDYRGVPGARAPNAEFRLGRGPGGELRMEVWSGRAGVGKGAELLVSYGKGWWGART